LQIVPPVLSFIGLLRKNDMRFLAFASLAIAVSIHLMQIGFAGFIGNQPQHRV
jgi:hypothetical protein